MKSVRSRLSFSNVVSMLALFVAVGGTAFAGPIARLVSGDKLIKRASLSGNRLRSHTLTAAQLDLAKLGLQRRTPWAFITADGKILAQSGGITNVHDPADCGVGCDFIDFGSSQHNRALVVTPNGTQVFETAYVCGLPGNTGGNPILTHCSGHNSPNVVLVRGTDPSSGNFSDSDFFIASIG